MINIRSRSLSTRKVTSACSIAARVVMQHGRWSAPPSKPPPGSPCRLCSGPGRSCWPRPPCPWSCSSDGREICKDPSWSDKKNGKMRNYKCNWWSIGINPENCNRSWHFDKEIDLITLNSPRQWPRAQDPQRWTWNQNQPIRGQHDIGQREASTWAHICRAQSRCRRRHCPCPSSPRSRCRQGRSHAPAHTAPSRPHLTNQRRYRELLTNENSPIWHPAWPRWRLIHSRGIWAVKCQV